MNEESAEELELITVTISLAATAMNENNCRTATGKPAFSGVSAKHVTSRNSAPRIWEGGKKFFHAVP